MCIRDSKLLLTYGKTDGRLKKSFATFWRGCVNCTFSRLSLERGFLVQLGTGHLQKHPFAVCCFRPPWVLKTRLHLALRQANLTWRPLLSNLNIKDVRVVLWKESVLEMCLHRPGKRDWILTSFKVSLMVLAVLRVNKYVKPWLKGCPTLPAFYRVRLARIHALYFRLADEASRSKS